MDFGTLGALRAHISRCLVSFRWSRSDARPNDGRRSCADLPAGAILRYHDHRSLRSFEIAMATFSLGLALLEIHHHRANLHVRGILPSQLARVAQCRG